MHAASLPFLGALQRVFLIKHRTLLHSAYIKLLRDLSKVQSRFSGYMFFANKRNNHKVHHELQKFQRVQLTAESFQLITAVTAVIDVIYLQLVRDTS